MLTCPLSPPASPAALFSSINQAGTLLFLIDYLDMTDIFYKKMDELCENKRTRAETGRLWLEHGKMKPKLPEKNTHTVLYNNKKTKRTPLKHL